MSLWVMLGRLVSFRPIMQRRRGERFFDLIFRVVWRVVMVEVVSSSMLLPIVADQREVRRWVFVQADQRARVWVRKRGSRRTSASSRIRLVMFGRGSGEFEFEGVMALRRERGVETRMSDLTRGVFIVSSGSDAESSCSAVEMSSCSRMPFLKAVMLTPVRAASFRPSFTIWVTSSLVGAMIMALTCRWDAFSTSC